MFKDTYEQLEARLAENEKKVESLKSMLTKLPEALGLETGMNTTLEDILHQAELLREQHEIDKALIDDYREKLEQATRETQAWIAYAAKVENKES